MPSAAVAITSAVEVAAPIADSRSHGPGRGRGEVLSVGARAMDAVRMAMLPIVPGGGHGHRQANWHQHHRRLALAPRLAATASGVSLPVNAPNVRGDDGRAGRDRGTRRRAGTRPEPTPSVVADQRHGAHRGHLPRSRLSRWPVHRPCVPPTLPGLDPGGRSPKRCGDQRHHRPAVAVEPERGRPRRRSAGDGNRVYLGGLFTAVGGKAHANVAAVGPDAGKPTAWRANTNGSVRGARDHTGWQRAAGRRLHARGRRRPAPAWPRSPRRPR